jgi:hypothetical protein
MKKVLALAVMLCMLAVNGALAAEMQYPNSLLFGLADGPAGSNVILVDLPEETVMTELVEFENGDFIQTFQLPYGGTAQILRYQEFDLTLEELAQGEWTGYTSMERLDTRGMDSFVKEAIHLKMKQDETTGTPGCDVYIVLAETKKLEQIHIFQAVFPSELGEAQIKEEIGKMLDSINIFALDLLEWG